jgi:peptidoglycan/xylan/chitin deacetylase (PgdA/CDA1 family)
MQEKIGTLLLDGTSAEKNSPSSDRNGKFFIWPSPWRQLVRRAMAHALPPGWFLVQGPKQSRSVCLTFDDGPHPVHTPRLLDALKKYGVKATFFVVGQAAERYPDLLRRLVAEGHGVGNHSFYHANPAEISAKQLMAEVIRTRRLLAKIVGKETNLFRPPLGKLTVSQLWTLWQAGQTIVLWNVDPRDYACQSADEVQARFLRRPLCGGDVVLMHDTLSFAADLIPDLLEAIRARGLTCVPATEWIR